MHRYRVKVDLIKDNGTLATYYHTVEARNKEDANTKVRQEYMFIPRQKLMLSVKKCK